MVGVFGHLISALSCLVGDSEKNRSSEKTWVALVSGLSVGAQEAPADLKAELLVEWLTGETGGPAVSLKESGWIWAHVP